MKKTLILLMLIPALLYGQRENFITGGMTINNSKIDFNNRLGSFIGIASSGDFHKTNFGVIGELQITNHHAKYSDVSYSEYALMANFAPYYRVVNRLKLFTGIQFGSVLYADFEGNNITKQIHDQIFGVQSGLIFTIHKNIGTSLRAAYNFGDNQFDWTWQIGVNYKLNR